MEMPGVWEGLSEVSGEGGPGQQTESLQVVAVLWD